MWVRERLYRPKTWFVAALVSALLTLGFAFTAFGLVTEVLTVAFLVAGATLLVRKSRSRLGL